MAGHGNGGALQELRESLDLTQKQAAKLMGIPREQLSRYESGASIPSFSSLRRMRGAYGVTADDLLAAFEAVHRRRARRNGKVAAA